MAHLLKSFTFFPLFRAFLSSKLHHNTLELNQILMFESTQMLYQRNIVHFDQATYLKMCHQNNSNSKIQSSDFIPSSVHKILNLQEIKNITYMYIKRLKNSWGLKNSYLLYGEFINSTILLGFIFDLAVGIDIS